VASATSKQNHAKENGLPGGIPLEKKNGLPKGSPLQ